MNDNDEATSTTEKETQINENKKRKTSPQSSNQPNYHEQNNDNKQ